jgi:hypothetical protein
MIAAMAVTLFPRLLMLDDCPISQSGNAITLYIFTSISWPSEPHFLPRVVAHLSLASRSSPFNADYTSSNSFSRRADVLLALRMGWIATQPYRRESQKSSSSAAAAAAAAAENHDGDYEIVSAPFVRVHDSTLRAFLFELFKRIANQVAINPSLLIFSCTLSLSITRRNACSQMQRCLIPPFPKKCRFAFPATATSASAVYFCTLLNFAIVFEGDVCFHVYSHHQSPHSLSAHDMAVLPRLFAAVSDCSTPSPPFNTVSPSNIPSSTLLSCCSTCSS